MPSPIGHGLAGVAAGWMLAPAFPPSRAWRVAALLAAAGAAPDLDLLFGAHSGPTHGLGAALLAGLTAFAWMRVRHGHGAAWIGCAVAAAYASHTLLDWLGTDTSPPIGIMALWPVSRDYHESPLHVFMAISRRYWLPEFWTYNLRALARELLILVPIVWIVVFGKRRWGGG